MLSNKSRNSCLAVSLSLAFAISSINTEAAGIPLPRSGTARATLVAAAVATFATWIRLQSKGTSKYMHYKWEKDWIDLFKIWNINTPEYRKLVDKYIVGRLLSICDYKYTDEKDGKQRTIKDKWVKSSPFGVTGLIHAYVLIQLAKLIELSGQAGTAVNAIYNFIDLDPTK